MSTAPSLSPAFAARIRQERLRQGTTQAEIAARTGMSVASYVRFEGSGRTTFESFLKIARSLGFELVLNDPDRATTPNAGEIRPRQRGLRRPRAAQA